MFWGWDGERDIYASELQCHIVETVHIGETDIAYTCITSCVCFLGGGGEKHL